MINRQKFSMVLGLAIISVHLLLSAYLWFIFSPTVDSAVSAKEIVLPLTVAYSSTVLKWFIDNQGHVTSSATIGIMYAVTIAMVSIFFLGLLCAGPWIYREFDLTPRSLNQFYAFSESVFGVLFVLILDDLFSKPTPVSDNTKKLSS